MKIGDEITIEHDGLDPIVGTIETWEMKRDVEQPPDDGSIYPVYEFSEPYLLIRVKPNAAQPQE